MFRRLLVSGLVLGALATTVGAATYAPFTDSATGTGTVTSATIDIIVAGETDDTFPLTFSPQNLLPNESSSSTVAVLNNSNRDIHLAAGTATVSSDNEGQCPSGWLVVSGFSVTDNQGNDHSVVHISDGGSENATLTVTLHNDAPETCQGRTFTVTLPLTATGVADGS